MMRWIDSFLSMADEGVRALVYVGVDEGVLFGVYAGEGNVFVRGWA
jgi:hypothetical protein